MYRRKREGVKIWWIVVCFVLVLCVWIIFARMFRPFVVEWDVTIQQWDSFSAFYSWLSSWDVFRVKRYMRRNDIDTTRLEVGNYAFAGTYTPATYVQQILVWSEKTFRRVTILEWWSVYDIDQYLHEQFSTQPWSYIAYVNNANRIVEFQSAYPFLQQAGQLSSLEWFLYPETYFIDNNADVVAALVAVQLGTFNTKVRIPLQSDITAFYQRLGNDFPRIKFNRYDIVTLASVVQKEERIVANQPTIAGIFLRRLQIGMRLDADITLCYGLHQPYSVCTPAYISRYITDDTNIFNTRRKWWLPPQAIANVPVTAIQAVLWYKNTDYLYYLHAPDGRIYYGSTLEEHNSNKQQYLR